MFVLWEWTRNDSPFISRMCLGSRGIETEFFTRFSFFEYYGLVSISASLVSRNSFISSPL